MRSVGAALNDDQVGVIPASREWFSASELAELGLPGLPGDKRAMNRRARDERWHLRVGGDGAPLSRPRVGAGGGTEFHVSLLPGAARIALHERMGAPLALVPEVRSAAQDSWRWYEGQNALTKAEAGRRVGIVGEIDLLEGGGMTRTAALAEASRRHGVATSTLWNWLRAAEGVDPSDRLPALAPRRRGGGVEVDIDPAIWTIFKSDFLRPSAPTLAACYERTAAIAAERGLSMPSEKTMRRRLDREVDVRVIKLRREGEEALRRSLPSQRRSVDELHAMELVNVDGHKFDVFVTPPDGGKPVRPILVGIQDVMSRKMLAWCIDLSENALQTRLAFAQLFEKFGIPKACLMDNGRAFASKWISGGAATRFRFKVKPEEPTGVLTGLGIKVHWALPYRGQSKPIERGFRDFCEAISRHPATEGAYTGNTPLAKPENYAKRAMGWDEFVAHVERGIAAHNAKLGRRAAGARGRSFDAVFAESYATAPIGKATPEQLRMALLAAEQKMVDRRTGEIALFGNRYWSDGCGQLHGTRVTVRFDPTDLMKDVHLYGLDGRYLTSAQVIADTGFLDAASARDAGKRVAEYRKRIRDAADAEQLLAAHDVARMQAGVPEPTLPEPGVLRPVRSRGQTAAALRAVPDVAPPEPKESRVFAALGMLRAVE